MTGGAFNRLGPRARAALTRVLETAVRAGRDGDRAAPGKLVTYAIDRIETAMILDAAEAASCEEHAFGMTAEDRG
jgi:hypothetical protein